MNGQQAAFAFQKIQHDISSLNNKVDNLTNRVEDLVQLLAPLLRPSSDRNIISDVLEASSQGNMNLFILKCSH